MLDLDIAVDTGALDRIAARMAAAVEQAVAETLADALARARRSLTGPRSGRVYRLGGRPHRASAPGEPPADRSGRLMRSLVVVADRLASTAPYARYLEHGTARMAPRPFIGPALAAARAGLPRRIVRALMEAAPSSAASSSGGT